MSATDNSITACAEHDFSDQDGFFLGQGAFGQVYRVACKTCHRDFARKTINLPTNASESLRKKQAKAMKCELEVLMDIRHRHVISYVHHTIKEQAMQIFTDYCEGGDLRAFMNKSFLSHDFTWSIFHSLSSALCQCHHGLKYTYKRGGDQEYYEFEDTWTPIIHRDIKPENIFISKSDESHLVPSPSENGIANTEDHLTVKLGDFGTASRLQTGARLSTWTGTRKYWAPEIEAEALKQEEGHSDQLSFSYPQITGWSEKTDVWSVGIILYEIQTGQSQSDARVELLRLEVKARRREVSEILLRITAECLDPVPEKRPSSLDMLAISLKAGKLAENIEMSESYWAALVKRAPRGSDSLIESTTRHFMSHYLALVGDLISQKEACLLMALQYTYIEGGILIAARRLERASSSGWAGGTIFHAVASATTTDSFLKELTWAVNKWPQDPLLAELSLKTNSDGLLPSNLAALQGDKEVARLLFNVEESKRKAETSIAVSKAVQAAEDDQSNHSRKEFEFFYLLLTKDDRSWTMKASRTSYALCLAATKGYLNVVSMLVEAGVDIESRSGNGKQTALQSAAASGQIDTVKLLLDKGARIETEDRTGRNAFHCGSWCGHLEVVKLLLARGALVNSKDHEGRTALLGAAGNGHGQVVQLLLDHGADKNLRGGGTSKETPLERAVKNRFDHIVQILSSS